jgi:hypothetical protein
MSQECEVALRRLPEGSFERALERSWSGRYVELDLLADSDQFQLGALVEIDTNEAIFLGEIQRRQGLQLWVSVEHSVNRAKLARIQEAWNEAGTRQTQP